MKRLPILAERIKEARSQKSLDQNELGKKIGHASGAQISRWEGGEPVSRANLEKLAEVLGVSTDWLLGRDLERAGGKEADESFTAYIQRQVVRYRLQVEAGEKPDRLKLAREAIEDGVQQIVPSATIDQIVALASIFLDPPDRPTQARQETENHHKRGG